MYTNLKDFSARTVSAISSDRAVKVELYLDYFFFFALNFNSTPILSANVHAPNANALFHYSFIALCYWCILPCFPIKPSPHLLVTGTEVQLCEPAAPPQQHPQPRPQLTLRRRKQVECSNCDIAVYIDIHNILKKRLLVLTHSKKLVLSLMGF